MQQQSNPNPSTPRTLTRTHWPSAGGATIGLIGPVGLRQPRATVQDQVLLQRWFVEEDRQTEIGAGPELLQVATWLVGQQQERHDPGLRLLLAGYEVSNQRSKTYFLSWAFHWMAMQQPAAIVLVNLPEQLSPATERQLMHWQQQGGLLYQWRNAPGLADEGLQETFGKPAIAFPLHNYLHYDYTHHRLTG
ncbi:MAG: hypothetical protein KDC54_14835 [Lewinella sp.]|nr:hypothetical protein [Lewinella sp.]